MYPNPDAIVINIGIKDKLLFPIITGLLVTLLGGLTVAYAVAVPPHVSTDTANRFFVGYLKTAPDHGQRYSLYRTTFTQDFRQHEDWPTYNAFWNNENYAIAGQAIPLPGNPLAFAVTITFSPVSGQPFQQTIDYYFSCNGFISSVIARISGCPLRDLRIDIAEWVNPGAS
jgi:hypothetical protein